jgi:hypothetical protein
MIIVVERKRAAKKSVQNHSAAPNVDFWPGVQFSGNDFRCGVVWRATGRSKILIKKTQVRENLVSATCLQKTGWRTGFLFVSSKSRQVSSDRFFFRAVLQTGRQNKIKGQETEFLSGFQTGQGATAWPCSAGKPFTGLFHLFYSCSAFLSFCHGNENSLTK